MTAREGNVFKSICQSYCPWGGGAWGGVGWVRGGAEGLGMYNVTSYLAAWSHVPYGWWFLVGVWSLGGFDLKGMWSLWGGPLGVWSFGVWSSGCVVIRGFGP